MSAVVVDTDVVSFLFKRDTRAHVYRPYLDGGVPTISFMTIAELDRWALARNWGEATYRRMQEYLLSFYVRLCDRDLCRIWAQVTDEARRAGRPIQCADAWVAAVAVQRGLPLITNNPDDYAGVSGLRVIADAASGA